MKQESLLLKLRLLLFFAVFLCANNLAKGQSFPVTGTVTDSTGKTSYTGSVKLNDKGDPIEETTTTPEKDSTKTEVVTYKYDATDDKGNWTQRTTYNDKGKATKVIKRTITYFKD